MATSRCGTGAFGTPARARRAAGREASSCSATAGRAPGISDVPDWPGLDGPRDAPTAGSCSTRPGSYTRR
eukprot:9931952-Alexandrium_andersonii.AAC.1